MIVFLLISYDFDSFSYECECILNSFLKKMIDILMFCYHFMMKMNMFSLLTNVFLLEMIVFLLISYDFVCFLMNVNAF